MYEVLFEVSTWSLCLPHVEVVFHAFVASSFPLVILVVEPVLRLRILLLAFVVNRVNLMVVVFGARDLPQFLRVGEVTLRAVTHRHAIEVVFADVACDETWLEGLILMWDLLMQFINARWDHESFLATHAVVQFWKRSVLVW